MTCSFFAVKDSPVGNLLKLQYRNATRLYRLSAAAHPIPLPVRSLPTMVEAGRGLLQCGEVGLAGQVLKYSLQAAPAQRKQSTESSQALTLALATLAQASVTDGTQSTAAKVAAIDAAAKARIATATKRRAPRSAQDNARTETILTSQFD